MNVFEKVNPKFRNLTDLLLFSNRMDLDLTNFKSLLRENHDIHSEYLWDRFQKSSAIFWEDGSQFWAHRLSALYSLNEKTLSQNIGDYIEKRMYHLVQTKSVVNPKYDIEFQQFLEYCKAKNEYQESLQNIKEHFLGLSSHSDASRLIQIVNYLIPFIFKDMNEYVDLIIKKITHSARNFHLLCELEAQGVVFNKQPIFQLAKDLMFDRALNDKNRRALFALISDVSIRQFLKTCYASTDKQRLMDFLEACDFQDIENNHLENVNHFLDIDSSLGDDLALIYADKLYARRAGHRKANADRLIRLLRKFPQIQPKKVLAYLSSNNKMSDIKYILTAFPNLKKLAAFV